MSYSVLVHLPNEDAVVGEVDDLPKPTDTILLVNNPRRRDGKDLHYLESSVTSVIWPLHRISFIEILPSEEEDRIIGFVRE